MNMPPIIIPLSKTKLSKLFIGAVLFVVLGFLFITKPFLFIKADDPWMIKVIGYASIAFFGMIGIYIAMKLFDKKPGMIIDAEGITDHSSGVAAGKILWKDVTNIFAQKLYGQKFIMLTLNNPEYYLRRETNPIRKRMMELNYKLYGTPVNITANGLNIEFEKLQDLIDKQFEKYKGRFAINSMLS